VVCICVRRTIDWRDEAAFRAQLDPAFAPKVDLWDETFTLPFHVFRQHVKEIAALSLAAVRDAACRPWDDIPEGSLVIPIDDDDWLSPAVAEVASASVANGAAGCYWITSHVEVPINLRHGLAQLRRRLWPRTRPLWTCSSNNYAFVKRPEAGTRLLTHSAANGWFEQAPAGVVRRIERRLSVQNRTLASQTSLAWRRPVMRRGALLRKYRRYRTLYASPVRAELAWCGPYLARMADLMSQLRLKTAR
jgi:hypothetical protein